MPELPSKFQFTATDPIPNFKMLESSPSSVLLAFDNVSNRLTPSFYHSIFGNSLAGEESTLFGLSGFGNEASAIIFSRSMFSSFKSEKVSIPSFDKILSYGPSAMGSEKGRVELSRFTLVPPVLIEALCIDDLTPPLVLGKSIELLELNRPSIDLIFRKIIRSSLIEENKDQDQPLSDKEIENQIDDDKINDLYEKSFSPFFTFLWSTCIPSLNERFSPTFGPLLHKPLIQEKVKNIHLDSLRNVKDDSSPPDSSLSVEKIQSIIEATTSAVMKSIDISNKDIYLPLSAEEKDDSKKMKVFNNLDDAKKNLILNLSSDSSSIPASPVSTCIEILSCKSGPSVASYLNNQFIDEDFSVSKGM